MDPGTIQSVLNAMQDQVTCPVCLEVFDQPKELPCRHTVCFSCCSKLIDTDTDNSTLKCAVCQSQCLLSLEELEDDNKVMKAVETYRILSASLPASAETGQRTVQACQIPRCRASAEKVAPCSRLTVCAAHYAEDVEKLKTRKEAKCEASKQEKQKLQEAVKNWKSLEESLSSQLDEVGAEFRQLQKAVKMRQEEVENDLEARQRSAEDAMKSCQALLTLLETKESEMNSQEIREDFVACEDTLRQTEALLESARVEDAPEIKVTVPLQILSSAVNTALQNCQLIEEPVEKTEGAVASSHEVLEISLTSPLACLKFCTNTVGYFSNPRKLDIASGDEFGSIDKGKTHSRCSALPEVVLLASYENYTGYIDVFDASSGHICGWIQLYKSLSIPDFVCDSWTQSLLVFFKPEDGLCRADLSGHLLSRFNLQLNSFTTKPFLAAPPPCQYPIFNVASDSRLFVVVKEPVENLVVIKYGSLSDSRQGSKRISVHNVGNESPVVGLACSYDNAFLLYAEEVHIISAVNGVLESKVTLSLIGGPAEICVVTDSYFLVLDTTLGTMYINEDNVVRELDILHPKNDKSYQNLTACSTPAIDMWRLALVDVHKTTIFLQFVNYLS